jgi:ankyrin repeat protein
MPPNLYNAIIDKNYFEVSNLLNKKPKPIPVDIRSEQLKTGLMLACSNKDPQTVGEFLKKGASLELTDTDDGWTALHYASQSGCYICVEKLIEKGANKEARTIFNETPLHLAATNNNHEVVKMLIEKKAQIDATNDKGETALHLATENNHIEVVNFLIENSANIEAQTEKGETALHIAVKRNYLEVVKLLIEKNANIEVKTKQKKTALNLATTLNHVSIVECLAEKNCQMKKALTYAVFNNMVETAKCLLSHLAATKGLNEQKLNQLLDIVVEEDHAKVATELLFSGANLDPREGIKTGLRNCRTL